MEQSGSEIRVLYILYDEKNQMSQLVVTVANL
jgi:hypothetical protein